MQISLMWLKIFNNNSSFYRVFYIGIPASYVTKLLVLKFFEFCGARN